MKTIRKFALLALFACSTCLSMRAAQSVTGTVKSYEDQIPLSGAVIRVLETPIQTATNDQGRFNLGILEAGQITITASYMGYGENRLQIHINENDTKDVEILLGENVVELDPLLVKGTKTGQAKALNIQRASNSLTNVIASDSFGNFPDENAAEALQRVSGISIERDQGEGRYVVVRGIDPDLNNIYMDGVSLTAPESDTRKVALDVVPTEILERIEVRKTTTPDMDGDAIGGSINMKTISAIDKGGEYASIKTQFLYNDLVNDLSPMASFAYGDTFGERNDIGFMIAASYQERSFGSDNVEVDGPWEMEDAEDGSSAFFAPEIEFREYEVTRKRKAISANIEKEFNDTSLFYIRSSYNYFSDQEYRSRTEIKLDDGQLQSITDHSALVTDIEETDRDLKDRFEEQEISMISVGGSMQLDSWTIDFNASIAHAEENEPNRMDTSFRSEALYDLEYDFSNAFAPELTVDNDASVFEAANFEFDEAVLENNLTQEDETSFKVDFRRDMIIGDNPGYLKFGVKYRTKEKEVDNEVKIYSNDSSNTTLANVIGSDSRYPYFTGGKSFLKADPVKTRQFVAGSTSEFEFEDEDTEIDSNASDYTTEEDILALYAMAETKFNQWSFTGGARLEQTDFTTRGNEVIFDSEGDLAAINPLTFSKDYDDLLGMISGRYDISSSTVFRTSWTNTIARPKFGDSAYRRERNIEDEEVTSGNPDLNPYESMNFDASIEHYLDGLGMISASVFHKSIDSFIFTEESKIIIDDEEFDFISPRNGNDAEISGVEISWSQDLGNFSANLNGFGIYTNLTLTDSKSTTDTRPGEELPFLKQSDSIANLALTYENDSYFIRLAGTYRSEYLDAIAGDESEDEYIDSHFQLDAKAVYKLNPHSSVFLELININEEPMHAYYGMPTRMRQNEEYSWSAKIGINWKR